VMLARTVRELPRRVPVVQLALRPRSVRLHRTKTAVTRRSVAWARV
jgi:hypothetical protein